MFSLKEKGWEKEEEWRRKFVIVCNVISITVLRRKETKSVLNCMDCFITNSFNILHLLSKISLLKWGYEYIYLHAGRRIWVQVGQIKPSSLRRGKKKTKAGNHQTFLLPPPFHKTESVHWIQQLRYIYIWQHSEHIYWPYISDNSQNLMLPRDIQDSTEARYKRCSSDMPKKWATLILNITLKQFWELGHRKFP